MIKEDLTHIDFKKRFELKRDHTRVLECVGYSNWNKFLRKILSSHLGKFQTVCRTIYLSDHFLERYSSLIDWYEIYWNINISIETKIKYKEIIYKDFIKQTPRTRHKYKDLDYLFECHFGKSEEEIKLLMTSGGYERGKKIWEFLKNEMDIANENQED